VKVSKC